MRDKCISSRKVDTARLTRSLIKTRPLPGSLFYAFSWYMVTNKYSQGFPLHHGAIKIDRARIDGIDTTSNASHRIHAFNLFHCFWKNRIAWVSFTSQLTRSQFWSFEIRRSTFPSYVHIVRVSPVLEDLKLWKGWSGCFGHIIKGEGLIPGQWQLLLQWNSETLCFKIFFNTLFHVKFFFFFTLRKRYILLSHLDHWSGTIGSSRVNLTRQVAIHTQYWLYSNNRILVAGICCFAISNCRCC